MSKVEIELKGAYGPHQIVVNGQDLANHVTGLHFAADVGGLPRLTLDLLVRGCTRLDSDRAELLMDPMVADLLVKAGWTPPEPGSLSLEPREQA